ncbi:hypothetical protein ACFYP4_15015 [Streptomyces sp. NPDC005551]|uniref:hypothetical protein n=1 Tax=unclassified Streptomyces TaxID=2593676 RepID=UPI0033E9526F
MTSATFSRQRVRSAAAAAGLAAALVLTACSSDGDGGSKKDSATSASPSSTTGADGDTGGSGSTSSAGKLEGSWLATTDGKAVALVVHGKEAGLFATGGTMCTGTAGKEAGMRMIHLKCPDGSADRSDGMVESVGSTTMKVKWEGGLQETYRKAEGAKLPTALPTASGS